MRHHAGPGEIDMKRIWTVSVNNRTSAMREECTNCNGYIGEELGRRGGLPREDDISAAH